MSGEIMADPGINTSTSTWHFIPARKDRKVLWRWQHRNKRHEVLGESQVEFAAFSECIEDARVNGYVERYKQRSVRDSELKQGTRDIAAMRGLERLSVRAATAT
jgi:hypothetical protein